MNDEIISYTLEHTGAESVEWLRESYRGYTLEEIEQDLVYMFGEEDKELAANIYEITNDDSIEELDWE